MGCRAGRVPVGSEQESWGVNLRALPCFHVFVGLHDYAFTLVTGEEN